MFWLLALHKNRIVK